ncbi:hypothetical protein IJG14_08460 [bacterium]|nr:hypothetical protein [bacterium]
MEKRVPKSVKLLGVIFTLISIFYAFYASCSQRGLFMDGAFYFIQLLNNISNKDFSFIYNPEKSRLMVQCLQELPVLFAGIALGIKSKITLSTIYSLTLFGLPLLALWWNYELTKRTKEYAILFWSIFTYSALILLYQILSVTETIIGIPFQFVLLNYLFGKINYNKLDKIGIAFIILLMFGIYEHTILLGFLLFVATFFVVLNEENESNMLVKIWIGAGSLAAAFYNFFYIIFHHNIVQNFVNFIKISTGFWSDIFHLNILFSILTVSFMFVLLFKKRPLKKYLSACIGILYLCLFIHCITYLPLYLNPVLESYQRGIVCWIVPLIFFGIILYKAKFSKSGSQWVLINNAYIPVLLCGIFLTLWQLIHTYYWNVNINYMKNEMANSEETLYIPDKHEEISSLMNNQLRRYILHGNYTATQIIFDKNYEIQTLLMHYDFDNEEGNKSYREYLWASPEKEIINIPNGIELPVVNSFWNIEQATQKLSEYNDTYNIQTLNEEDF